MTNNQSFFESIDKSEKIFTNDYTVSRIRKKILSTHGRIGCFCSTEEETKGNLARRARAAGFFAEKVRTNRFRA